MKFTAVKARRINRLKREQLKKDPLTYILQKLKAAAQNPRKTGAEFDRDLITHSIRTELEKGGFIIEDSLNPDTIFVAFGPIQE